MNKILFVNQEKSQCGVYQFGKNTAFILSKFKDEHSFDYLETDSPNAMLGELTAKRYDLVILNHHPCTMGWANEQFFANNQQTQYAMLMHDSRIHYSGVDAILHPDPCFTNEGIDYAVGRPILEFDLQEHVLPDTIGSFGFGFDHKGFLDLAVRVNEEFDVATLRIHIPLNTKVDETGYYAYRMAKKLKDLPLKEGIELIISHDYKSESELVQWLAQNTINVFLYKGTDKISEGCSSTVDWALAAKRPIALSNDRMFRHVLAHAPELATTPIKELMTQGAAKLQFFYENWSERKLYKQYCEIVNEIVRS